MVVKKVQEDDMGCLFMIFLLIVEGPILLIIGLLDGGSSGNGGSSSGGYSSSYRRREEDCYCYPEDNDYYTDDYNHNYNSYYGQLHDEAMAGDEDAISEMREEFGDDWEGMYS